MNMDIDKLILRKLAKQAGMSDDKYGMFFADVKHNEDGVDLQMFTELIIRECLNELCEQMDKHHIDLSNLPSWYKALAQTEKHFGIEE